ncbi:MAG: 50S ribosomal protein L22 [candidate division Zixibacteria bacterium]
MQAKARLRYLMMSPRKIRRVVELIKGKSVEDALTILRFTNKAAAGPLSKTIQSATANALAIEGTSHLKVEDLSIASINVDEGPQAKRIRFRAMGRVYRYKKRFTHLTVVVEGEPTEEVKTKRTLGKKKAVTEKKPAAKATPKKTTKKKPAAKKTTTRKTTTKKTTTKKTTAKKTTAKKTDETKKTTAKKTAAKNKKTTTAKPKDKPAAKKPAKKKEKE